MTAVSPERPPHATLDRWDDVVARWRLDPSERDALLGGFGLGAITDVAAYEAGLGEQRMRLLVALDETLQKVFGDEERARGWLRARNRRLGDASPMEMMATSSAWTRWLTDHLELTA